ncbi:Hypothetical predicted protein [Lecanosticta acicola]|uniref:Uncharacterized protein n=1 Tax=Lecanosticta acicola TaxID=111012 RepID=A0AAI8YUE2_9PEZI|nr:Hypothetical predicted protein [Lecanosticta acicola]
MSSFDKMALQEPAGSAALRGLYSSMSPIRARELITKAGLKAHDDEHIMNNLRTYATTLYNHEKLCARYHSRIEPAANCIAFFICAAHGQSFHPESQEILNANSLRISASLPLGFWKGTYLALVAEVQILYNDLRANLSDASTVLHYNGYDGTAANSAFTAWDLAVQLENMWDLLMDARAVGPIEHQVRYQSLLAQQRADRGEMGMGMGMGGFEQQWQQSSEQQRNAALDNYRGMVDATSLTPEALLEHLWTNEVPAIRHDCRTIYHIDIGLREPQQVNDTSCECEPNCRCRLVCQFDVGPCQCKESRRQARHPQPMRADHGAGEPSGSTAPPLRRRERKGTSGSQLAYVPGVRTPTRGHRGKDTTPLEFYGSGSGERYPKFTRPAAMDQSPPVYGPRVAESPTDESAGWKSSQEAPGALPDFIAPRPALKQRYFSAGGDVPLHQRPEIQVAMPPPAEPGWRMSKEQVEAFYQQQAVTSSPPQQSQPGSSRASQERVGTGSSGDGRASNDTPGSSSGGQRGRGGSSSSWRIKNFFSKHSSSD